MKIPLVFALVGTLASISLAQNTADTLPDPPTLLPNKPQERTFQLPIRNVKASVMAWWHDPQNHEPPQFSSLPPSPMLHEPGKLPDGAVRIVAVDPQNVLLVVATPEGAARIANTIRSLDRPIRQVEIEARFFQVAADEVANLDLDFITTASPTRMGRVKPSTEAKLKSLIERKKATIITAPRVTTFNRTKTPLPISSMRPITWSVNKLFKEERFDKLSATTTLQAVDNQLWQLTPTINNDDTVTLETEGEQTVELRGEQEKGALILERQQLPQLVVNLRDGETIAIEKKALPSQEKTSTAKTIVLLTTRIVRRVEADK